ncbi:hypothetical protein RZS08_04485, partial [Arthrospira platensis SPKY1]|nr:hypothetical protein [Arthrospira platensis SPKY1]
GRVHPFHARARGRRAVGGPVSKLAADRPCLAEGREPVTDGGPIQRRIVPHAVHPSGGPAQRFHELPGQTERQVEPTHQVAR